MFYYIIKILVYLPVRMFWLGKVSGLKKITREKSFIIAANHTSYLDFILLFVVVQKKVSFLAAEKFFLSKFWRPIMLLTDQIRVNRLTGDKTNVYKDVDKAIKEGRVIGIFPEGTRSRDGKIGKVYNGVAKFAYKYNVPVFPIGIKNAYYVWPPHKKFPKIKHCDINIGDPIFIHNDNFDEFTSQVMERIVVLSSLN